MSKILSHPSPNKSYLRDYNLKRIVATKIENENVDVTVKTEEKMAQHEEEETEQQQQQSPDKKQKKKKKNQAPPQQPQAPQPIEQKSLFDSSLLNIFCKTSSTNKQQQRSTILNTISSEHPLQVLSTTPSHSGHIYSMCLSSDGEMLATASTMGSVRIFDTDSWELIQELRDVAQKKEKEQEHPFPFIIEEYFCCMFTPNDTHIVVAGKSKDRYKWDEHDDDNKILPCPVKIFDITKCDAPVSVLEGHTEEVLCMTSCCINTNDYYIVTGSYDGSIKKWKMQSNHVTCDKCIELQDGISNVVLSLAFVPQTGCKYLVAACDNKIKLFDFYNDMILQEFESGFSAYCDFVQFVQPSATEGWLLLARGSELVVNRENVETQVAPNKCKLFQLQFPKQSPCYIQSSLVNNNATKHETVPFDAFKLELVRTFAHAEYMSNFWLVKVRQEGNYLFAPTMDGKVFIFSIKSGSVVGVLKDHDAEACVRDVCVLEKGGKVFVLTCGDDATIKIYE